MDAETVDAEVMDTETIERLVAEFRACLEDGPETVDVDAATAPPVNLALLFTELAVLRNEVRTQARQFKTALDDMRALNELLGAQNQRLTHDLERARATEGTAQRQTERRLLLDLLDVRDRIEAAVVVFQAWQPSLLSRFAPTETKLAQGLGAGIELTLRRLDDLLVERRVRPIDAIGNRLDPNTMRAVAVENIQSRAAGEVLREVRRGYLRHDELLRLAEVIVNKKESES